MTTNSRLFLAQIFLLIFVFFTARYIYGQDQNQSLFGFPNDELTFVDLDSGNIIVPCFSLIQNNKVIGHYSAELSVLNEEFPFRFELESALDEPSCDLISRLADVSLHSIVQVDDESQQDVIIPFQYTLTYVGTNENGKEELTLDEFDIHEIIEGESLLEGDPQGLVLFTPEQYQQSNLYEIRDAFSHEVLNETWQLTLNASSISFTPIGSVVCDVVLIDQTNSIADYLSIDTDSNTTNTNHPTFRNCQQRSDYSRYNFGLFDLPADPESFDFLAELDTGWVRSQFRLGEKTEATLLAITENIFADQNKLWLTLHYRKTENVIDVEGLMASERGSYPAADTELYKSEVTDFVNIFVSQLLDVGLDPKDYLIVQFSNEVVPSDVAPDQSLRYFHGTSDEYLSMLELTYDAVKDTGFDIPVALGGFASATLEIILDYESDPEQFADLAPIYDWNVRLLKEGTYDWVDAHLRNEIADIDSKVNWLTQHWLGPIASTEVGGICDTTCSDEEIAEYTPELQATDLPLRMQTILESGVKIAFWASLVESPDQEPQYEKEGLLTTEFEKKPAFNAYRDIIVELIAD